MSQWAVVYFPFEDLVAEAVGPYRSRKRAEAVADRIASALDDDPAWHGAGAIPQVVRLGSAKEVSR